MQQLISFKHFWNSLSAIITTSITKGYNLPKQIINTWAKKNAWPDTKCICLRCFNKKNLKSSYRHTLSLISLSGSVANNIFTKVVFPLSTAIYRTVFPSYNNTNRSPCIYRLMSPRCLMTKNVFPKIHDQHRKASIAVFLLKIPSYHQEFECSVNHLKNILCTNLSFSIYIRIFS